MAEIDPKVRTVVECRICYQSIASDHFIVPIIASAINPDASSNITCSRSTSRTCINCRRLAHKEYCDFEAIFGKRTMLRETTVAISQSPRRPPAISPERAGNSDPGDGGERNLPGTQVFSRPHGSLAYVPILEGFHEEEFWPHGMHSTPIDRCVADMPQACIEVHAVAAAESVLGPVRPGHLHGCSSCCLALCLWCRQTYHEQPREALSRWDLPKARSCKLSRVYEWRLF